MLSSQVTRKVKPTNHQCLCGECRKPIRKGEVLIEVLADVWENKANSYDRYHPACFLGACLRIAKIPHKGGFMKGFEMAMKLSGHMEEETES